MDFAKLVEQALNEEMVAGGEGSVYGPNVTATSKVFSGDHYAPGDARVAKSLYGGVLTRGGMTGKKRKKKRKKKRS
jgi:hypothetical protein